MFTTNDAIPPTAEAMGFLAHFIMSQSLLVKYDPVDAVSKIIGSKRLLISVKQASIGFGTLSRTAMIQAAAYRKATLSLKFFGMSQRYWMRRLPYREFRKIAYSGR